MAKIVPLLLVGLTTSTVIASDDVTYPKDVQRFITKREDCDHFRGEIGDVADQQQQKEVQLNLKKLCAGTDRQLNALLKKYKGKASIIERLSEFETDIEAP